MKKIIIIMCMLAFGLSKSIAYPPLYTKTFTVKGKVENMTSSMSIITSQYFQTTLGSMAGTPTRYQASNELVKPKAGETFYSVSQSITDKAGKPLFFNSPMEFLNFMDEHGYELFEQTKNKYGADYTFKRKK